MQNLAAVSHPVCGCKRTEEAARTEVDEASLNQSQAEEAASLRSAACPVRPEEHKRLACAGAGRST